MAVASRIPSRVPVSLIGRSRDRMGNLKVILNNRYVRDLNWFRQEWEGYIQESPLEWL
ncbi:hypothetical protein Hanom_Chr05g00435251 [Helianthus anomalus]